MHPMSRLAIAVMLSASVVACSKKVKEVPPPPATDTTGTTTGTPDAGPYTAPAGAYTAADLDRDACLRIRAFYFDLDRDNVKPEFQNAILCHAKYLRDRPMARLTLEGNTDERGSQEYNLALGERRANSVAQALQAQGASGSQINVVTYGEERPVCREAGEGCWSRNRRADLNYTVP